MHIIEFAERTDEIEVFSMDSNDSFFEPLAPFNTPDITPDMTPQKGRKKVLRVLFIAFTAVLVLATLVAFICGIVSIGSAKQLQQDFDEFLGEKNIIKRLLVSLKDRVENMEGWSDISR